MQRVEVVARAVPELDGLVGTSRCKPLAASVPSQPETATGVRRLRRKELKVKT